eukprot:2998094-Karenia_brevis.AAC.1
MDMHMTIDWQHIAKVHLCFVMILCSKVIWGCIPVTCAASSSPDLQRTNMGFNTNDDNESVSSRSSVGGMMILPVLLLKNLQCKLCGCWCNEDSPVYNATGKEHPKYGQHRPWLYYIKHPLEDGYKTPSGRYCLFCFNVFRLSLIHI